MLIDEDPDTVDLLKHMLQQVGYENTRIFINGIAYKHFSNKTERDHTGYLIKRK